MNHKNEPEHEMLNVPLESSYSSLPNSEDAHNNEVETKSQLVTETNSKFRDLLRHFGLQGLVTRLTADTEARKVAVYQSRTVAVGLSLLHAIPLAGAIVLLVFQWTSYWVSVDNDYSTSLQFAAKVHELTMQASLIDILLCIVRAGLVDGLVPLGALSGAIQATRLSYLWSVDFFSIFTSRALVGWRKWMFAVCIPALISLTSLVGPSSAVLMIPRPGSSHSYYNELKYWSLPEEDLYPARISAAEGLSFDTHTLNTSLMYAFDYESPSWDPQNDVQFSSRVYPNATSVWGSPVYGRILRFSRTNLIQRYDTGRLQKVNATIVPNMAALEHRFLFGDRRNTTTSTVMAYPVVEVQCFSISNLTNASSPVFDWGYHNMSTKVRPDLQTVLTEASGPVEVHHDPLLNKSNIWFTPVWPPSPEPGSPSLLVVFLSANVDGLWNDSQIVPSELPSILEKSEINVLATTCTIAASWNTGEVQAFSNAEVPIIKSGPKSTSRQSDARLITLDVTDVAPLHTATFHRVLSSTLRDGLNGSATSLAAAMAIALSMVPGSVAPLGKRQGQWSSAWRVPQDVDVANYTAFETTVTQHGYGYGTRPTSVYLSLGVMLLYCTIVIGYITYTLLTGSASTAWNSGIELFTLALQSKKPEHLGHTSVGMDSIKTFSEGVGVRVNEDSELEVVFARDGDFVTRGLQKIVKNKKY